MRNQPYLINKSIKTHFEMDALRGCNIGWSDNDECIAYCSVCTTTQKVST